MLVAVQPVTPDVLPRLRDVVALSYERGADAVELRLDFLPDPSAILELLQDIALSPLQLPWLACLRRPQDLGHCTFDEAIRLGLLAEASVAGASIIDVECDADLPKAIRPATTILRSFHDREATRPAAIRAAMTSAFTQGHAFKAATMATNLGDNLHCRDLLKDTGGRATVFCMGAGGLPSRLLGPYWGSFLTYAAAPDTHDLAPSLPSLDDMVRQYGFHRFKPSKLPKLYGVVGEFVASSLSPCIHNGCFRHAGADALYLPLVTNSFADAQTFANALGFAGLSVTIPFKDEALAVAQAADEAASACGAANTLCRADSSDAASGWNAANTDGEGFLRDLLTHMTQHQLQQANVLVLGYGGSARAIVHALKGRCRQIFLTGRNHDKTADLAREFGVVAGLPDDGTLTFGLVVNATPLGMKGSNAAQGMAFDPSALPLAADALIYDLVYDPPRTPLMRRARELNVKAVGGIGMLLQQALLQQETWGFSPSPKLRDLLLPMITRTLRNPDARRTSASIALVGFRCSGKSSVGRRLADAIGLRFIDLDDEIEQRLGTSVADCFATEGEAAFRRHEMAALHEVVAQTHEPFVLATGGGCVETPEVRRLLSANFTVIALKARESVLLRRLEQSQGERPRLEAGFLSTEVSVRLARRQKDYDRLADFGVNTDGVSIEGVVRKILLRLRLRFV